MTDQPERPEFKDGQPLAAADLDLIVGHARNAAARHERAAHTPGIVTGLRLLGRDGPPTPDGVVPKLVTITAGIAVDGAGREIVVPADVPLRPQQFVDDIGGSPSIDTSINNSTTFPYPVFITLDERTGPVSAFTAGGCDAAAGPGRVIEDYQIRIGRRGEHLQLAAQQSPGPGDDLDSVTRTFRVLLGFVRFHVPAAGGTGDFVAVVGELDNVRPRAAGVRAGEVVTAGDGLILRTGDPLAAGQPAVALETGGGGRLRFGKTNATGGVNEVFAVSADGNVTIAGRLDPGLVVGSVRMYSAQATDGMVLPLPPGVDPAAVAAGKVAVHTTVTPHLPDVPGTVFLVERCDVTPDRRARCRLHRTPVAPLLLTPLTVAVCDVVMTAIVEAPDDSAGGTP